VDDERLDRDFLKKQLMHSAPEINVIAEYSVMHDARAGIPLLNFHLLFLDIQLDSGHTAFDLLDHFHGHVPPLIFVTSYEKYALRALRSNAIDYLLKPVDTAELKLAIAKFSSNNLNMAAIPAFKSDYHIAKFDLLDISEVGAISYLPIEKILYLSSDTNYTNIHFLSDNSELIAITSTKNLGYYETRLQNSGFIRIHQSFLINGRHVRKISKSSSKIFLKNNIELTIARDRKQELIRKMTKMIY
jgi:two-component system LytT family response regulator